MVNNMLLYDKLRKINNFIVENLFILIVLCLIFVLFTRNNNAIGISKQYNAENAMEYANDMASAPMLMSSMSNGSAKMATMSRNLNKSSSKIVKSFSLSIEVKNVEKIKDEVEKKINEIHGQTNNFYSYTYGNSNQLAYNFNIQIPSDVLEQTIVYFKTLGLVKSESSSAVDMQERYTDNENRLKNLYARRDRLRKMMESKTEKLSDVIAVDRELNNVQNEIEALERSNKVIDTNVSLSSVDLSILPEVKIENFNNTQWQLSTAWKQAINDLIIFGQKAVNYGLKIVVFLPVIIIILGIVYILKRKYK